MWVRNKLFNNEKHIIYNCGSANEQTIQIVRKVKNLMDQHAYINPKYIFQQTSGDLFARVLSENLFAHVLSEYTRDCSCIASQGCGAC